MIKSLILVFLSSSLVSALNLLCQDSSLCNKGSKFCEVSGGGQWCCKQEMCDESKHCSFLPSETSLIEKIFHFKPSYKKIKYNLCERIENRKTIKVSRILKPKLDGLATNVTDINCPGRKQRCPPQNTCCLIGEEKYGCCRYSEAVCCSDLIHCCPPGTVCNVETMECTNKYRA